MLGAIPPLPPCLNGVMLNPLKPVNNINCIFCQKRVLVCFVCIAGKILRLFRCTALKDGFFWPKVKCVHCAVRSESLTIIQGNFYFVIERVGKFKYLGTNNLNKSKSCSGSN